MIDPRELSYRIGCRQARHMDLSRNALPELHEMLDDSKWRLVTSGRRYYLAIAEHLEQEILLREVPPAEGGESDE